MFDFFDFLPDWLNVFSFIMIVGLGVVLLFMAVLSLRNPLIAKLGVRNIPRRPTPDGPDRGRLDPEHRDHRQRPRHWRHARLFDPTPRRQRLWRDRRDRLTGAAHGSGRFYGRRGRGSLCRCRQSGAAEGGLDSDVAAASSRLRAPATN